MAKRTRRRVEETTTLYGVLPEKNCFKGSNSGRASSSLSRGNSSARGQLLTLHAQPGLCISGTPIGHGASSVKSRPP